MVNTCRIDHDVEVTSSVGRLSDENVQRVVIVQIESTNTRFAAGAFDRPGNFL